MVVKLHSKEGLRYGRMGLLSIKYFGEAKELWQI